MSEEPLCRLRVVGDAGVGKSSLINMFVEGCFAPNHPGTVLIDFRNRILEVCGRRIKLQIWDTWVRGVDAVQLPVARYRPVLGFIICYDTTQRTTFEGVGRWLRQIQLFLPESIKCVLVGCKIDKTAEREVDSATGRALADSLNIPFVEVSAATGENVDVAFARLVAAIYEDADFLATRRAVGVRLPPPGSVPRLRSEGRSMCGMS